MRFEVRSDILRDEPDRQRPREVFDPPLNLRSIEFETGAVRQPEESPRGAGPSVDDLRFGKPLSDEPFHGSLQPAPSERL